MLFDFDGLPAFGLFLKQDLTEALSLRFHTVGPKYKEKFHTAAEGALFNCYFKVLNALREHKVTTLALCPINTGRPFEAIFNLVENRK